MKHVDLDDSRVVDIKREGDSLSIRLERFGKGILVYANGVSREDTECYVGNKITGPHPEPTIPVKEIEVAEMAPGILELQGGRFPELNWYLWRILAKNIEIRYQNQ